jgi:hypothetical protein
MDNKKKILLGVGALVVGLGVYFFMRSKKVGASTIETLGTDSIQSTLADGTLISLGDKDPSKAVYLVLGGKKYAFVSEEALTKYGFKTPVVIEKTLFDTLPSGGFVDANGKVVVA